MYLQRFLFMKMLYTLMNSGGRGELMGYPSRQNKPVATLAVPIISLMEVMSFSLSTFS